MRQRLAFAVVIAGFIHAAPEAQEPPFARRSTR